ncbi:uncharacterized protein LOC107857239 [Capsicum annuum]|uniref:uncharacterized protein LOC107857239 n=1 Tax=Capsicum annuum TaxID=4072 RepID=UPI001FB0B44F|nr:uncharacterized protein LOC107857239 [Capsicum annuum]
MNGEVKAANKNIKRILRKIVDGNREWHENLPYALLEYRTIIRTSTGETPYILVYGLEEVIPAEVEIPLLRVIQKVGLDDAQWICRRIEQLMLIYEKRLDAVYHGQLYQNRMIKAFNKKVKPRRFTPGQLVLKKIFLHQDEAKREQRREISKKVEILRSFNLFTNSGKGFNKLLLAEVF